MMELTPEHMKLYKKFKRCVDAKSIEKMDTKLYHFFMYHAGFIAHYNIHGFRSEYSGQNFLSWFKCFAEPNWSFYLPQGDEWHDLKKACVLYAQEKQEEVFAYFERQLRNQKIAMLESLSKDLGMVVVSEQNKQSTKTVAAPSSFYEEENGQLLLFG